MLYLAQVHKNDFLDQYNLRLLARQEAENFWLTISESDSVVFSIETLIILEKLNTRTYALTKNIIYVV